MSDASTEQHEEDVANRIHVSSKNTTEGGRCLNRHVAAWEPVTCSHRWQAYKHALDHSHLYNWPAYKKLARGKDVRTDAMRNYTSKSGALYPIFPEGYRFLLKAPHQGDWDVSESGASKNFKWDYRTPYLHNGHHVVTNSQLRVAINKLEKKFPNATLIIRRGLARAGYNLNHKLNMVILPMDRKVAGALNLPRHLATFLYRDHRAYSDYVSIRLDAIMRTYEGELRKYVRKEKEHTKLAHELAKEQIEELSHELYAQITARQSQSEREGSTPGYTGTLDSLLNRAP
ncbi:AHH domain-containing protein [Corallococcus sp. M34]|uniref:AHH domain-containing protein n=1 Tax=Citreicoccus inhibens TaxID=2849499 RepID=UPI001C250099|nr:AHH domain-containing protein [Citreicoccus inhibens]MBU8899861.1 AHH domain-containing protein [Citreicoccus inhibens]